MKHAIIHSRNYARNLVTGEYIFFRGVMPALSNPEFWAFWQLPLGADAETFRGRLVGVNPAGAEPGVESEPTQ